VHQLAGSPAHVVDGIVGIGGIDTINGALIVGGPLANMLSIVTKSFSRRRQTRNLRLDVSDFHFFHQPPDPTSVPDAVVIFAAIIALEVFPDALLRKLAEEKLVIPFFVAEAVLDDGDVKVPEVWEIFAAEKSLPMHRLDESSALEWEVIYGPNGIYDVVKEFIGEGSELCYELGMRRRRVASAFRRICLQVR
jgi:hypothetical protein